jgi:hypothetical protein
MGFEVHVVVMLSRPPTDALITALDHQFGVVASEAGSRVVTITEHVSVANETDAVEFVRGLVLEAVPQGSKISDVSAVAG